jgi:hypothetical protein
MVCLGATLGMGDAAQAAPAGTDTIEQTCRHYDNRARFESRAGRVALVVLLSQACEAAAATLGDPNASPDRRAAAEGFLERLTFAREQINMINASRARFATAERAGPDPFPQPQILDLSQMIGLVTPTGEYLILRLSGAMEAMAQWNDALGAVAQENR